MYFNIKSFILFLLISPTLLVGQINQDVYNALESKNLVQIETEINNLNNNKETANNNAYLGALYMKKADFLKDVKIKISTFKKGKELLEKEILNHNENIEYIFLRFAIQENAPKILKYNINLDSDKKIILDKYESLKSDLKATIKKYSKTSKLIEI